MIRKIGLMLVTALLGAALIATCAMGESEPQALPLEAVQLEPTVSFWASAIDAIPVPWDAYRVVSDDLCDPAQNYNCYFVPGVDADEVYFLVGRYLHSVGAKLIWETPELQLWDLSPYIPGSTATGFVFSGAFSDGTLLRVQR